MTSISFSPKRLTSEYKNGIYLILAFVLMFLIHFVPVPKPFYMGSELVQLTGEAKDTLAVFAFAIFSWMTGAVPFVITAFITLLLIPAFGVSTFSDTVAASFGDPLILFFIGVMMVSAAFRSSGLSTRLSRLILGMVGKNPSRIILVFLIFGAFSAMWFTEVAAAALFTPLAVGILDKCGIKAMKSNFGKSLLIACAWGPLVGGMGTPVGSGSNVLAISLLNKYANLNIGFLDWMAIGVPAVIVLVPIAWLIITRAYPSELDEINIDDVAGEAEKGLNKKEIATMVIFSGMIVLWLAAPSIKTATGGRINLTMQIVAILGGILLFIPGLNIFSWKDVEKSVDWGGIILITSGLALGKIAFDTGAARWLAWVIAYGLRVEVLPPVILAMFAVLVVGIIHLCFSSNTVTGAVTVPLMIAMGSALHVSPWFLAVPAAYSACMAFILVTETPTSVIPYSAGYFSLKDMALIGIPMTIIVSVVAGAVFFGMAHIVGM
ncbi:MAG: DASS family sodium-coupled anion symporter [Firmicutes bacterium]|nr:DASS family sodium-coupled anion symporter [Bacillota bacterium]